jgi:alpha-L-fucosidase
MTCNESWSYHPDAEKYKPTRDLVRKLCEIRSLGGNLLLNVGPDSRGRFPEPAVKRFLEIGEWLRRSGDSIYGAARGVDYLHYWGPSTRNGNTLYCHLLTRPDPELELRGIASDPERVFVLQTGQVLPFQRVSNRIVIDFAACEFDPLCTTVALAFSEAPASLQFASTVFTTRGPALW